MEKKAAKNWIMETYSTKHQRYMLWIHDFCNSLIMNELVDKRLLLRGSVRTCPQCGEEKELTEDYHFHRANDSFCRLCKLCTNLNRNLRNRGKDIPIPKWTGKAAQQKRREAKRNGTYIDQRVKIDKPFTVKDLARKTHRESLKNDKMKDRVSHLSIEFVEKCLTVPCFYCGLSSQGIDRIDNLLGHTEDNCVPCCTICNLTRRDEFTVEEMKKLGFVIRQIKLERNRVEGTIEMLDFNYLFNITAG